MIRALTLRLAFLTDTPLHPVAPNRLSIAGVFFSLSRVSMDDTMVYGHGRKEGERWKDEFIRFKVSA